MTRCLPPIIEHETICRLLFPEVYEAISQAHSAAIDSGLDPTLARKHLQVAAVSARREATLIMNRLDAAGLEIRHKRIRP